MRRPPAAAPGVDPLGGLAAVEGDGGGESTLRPSRVPCVAPVRRSPCNLDLASGSIASEFTIGPPPEIRQVPRSSDLSLTRFTEIPLWICPFMGIPPWQDLKFCEA